MPAPRTSSDLPYPEGRLLHRIGPMEGQDPLAIYEETGRGHREMIESLLPADWSWQGRRILDFGCGVGRVVRQFAERSAEAEVWGCDIDEESIGWLQEHLSPPFHFFVSEESPGLPQDDGFFDLIYALSVYTHLTDNWAGWLLEHHRALAEGGLMIVTFLGKGASERMLAEPYDEDRIGMNSLGYGHPWDLGGPTTLHSPWWIRAHWGRAFEILDLRPPGVGDPPADHGIVVMRKRAVQLTEDDLTAPEPGEPREIAAIRHHVEQLRDETIRLSDELRRVVDEYGAAQAAMEASASWRITAPLRAAKRRLRRPA
jgi:SAM-dependent methyltransferase